MQKLINLLGVEVNVAASSSSEEVADHRTPLGTQSGWLVVPDVVWPKQGFVQSLDNYNWSCSLFSLQCYFKLPGAVALPRAVPRGGLWPMRAKQEFVQRLDNYNWSCSLSSLQCYFKLPGCVALPRAAPRGGLWAMCPKQEFVQRLDNYNW